MARGYYENQLFQGTSWHGFTPKNHLINAFDFNEVAIMDKVAQIHKVNGDNTFVDMVMNRGIEYIDPGKTEFQWYLDDARDTFYYVEAAWEDRAGTVALGTTDGFKPGVNRTKFYLDFKGKVFNITETIAGERPDVYRLRVDDNPINVGGDIWRMEVSLQSARNSTDYIPVEEVTSGTRWSCESGLVAEAMSQEGVDIDFKTKSKLNGYLSSFRVQHTIAGNMTNIRPMGFYIKGTDGKNKKLWLSNVEYEFLRKIKKMTAALVMNGKSNVWDDGTVGTFDKKNGYEVRAGSGFKEQWSPSNKHTFNTEPDLDELTEIALDATVNEVGTSERVMVIKAGEYGLMELSRMVQRKLGSTAIQNLSYLQDSTGRAFKWGGNDIDVNLGQFKSVAVINGIKFIFMLDASKDDPARNKMEHPKGGLASSYEYDIMGFGNADEKSNMKIVRRKDENPIFGAKEGMRGFFSSTGTSFGNPKSIASSLDGSTIHYFEPGIGAMVVNPDRVIQYHPSILN